MRRLEIDLSTFHAAPAAPSLSCCVACAGRKGIWSWSWRFASERRKGRSLSAPPLSVKRESTETQSYVACLRHPGLLVDAMHPIPSPPQERCIRTRSRICTPYALPSLLPTEAGYYWMCQMLVKVLHSRCNK
uniref:Uncharacterized protein n=1 Tax=Triticum urartu TaxID=4572 RepID=A0A8R7VJE4_TRIUA